MSENSFQPMYCYAHPQRETLLRCNQCDRPMCTSCAVRTPTGYRCKECVKGQQKIFETARWWNYPLTIIVAGFLAYFGSLFIGLVGFFAILLGPVAGMIIAEAVRWVNRKRRAKLIPLLACIGVLTGALLPVLFILLLSLISANNFFGVLFSMIWSIAFAILAATTAYYRLKGIRV